MDRPLNAQLLDAFEKRGMTWEQLRTLSRVECSVDSLARKLRGQQSLRSTEVEKLATALRIRVAYGRAA